MKIEIDNRKYDIGKDSILGSELKQLAGIPLDKALVQEVKGAPDIDISNDTIVHLEKNMEFLSELYDQKIKVTIDGEKITLTASTMTGAELKKQLGITSNDTKLIRDDDAIDVVFQDNVTYEIRKNDEFFTMPAGINNGGTVHGALA